MFSPDSAIRVSVYMDSAGTPFYRVFYNDDKVIGQSQLGIALKDSLYHFSSNLKIVSVSDSAFSTSYTTTTGKRLEHEYQANQTNIQLENEFGNKMDIVFQLSEQGVAFRYQLYNSKSYVLNETSEFNLAESSLVWIQEFNNYSNDYENFYIKRLVDTMSKPAYYIPALARTPDSLWVFVSDADIDSQYVAAQLIHKGEGRLAIHLPDQTIENPSKGEWEVYVSKEPVEIIAYPDMQTPWRFMIIGEGLANIVESDLITSLNDPSKIEDGDWIQPGVVTFPWWGNSLANDDPQVMKEYIDFAAEMDWDYVEFDIGLIGNNGGLAANFWRDIDYIPEVIEYAKNKGIKVIGWDERRNLDTPEKRDDIFSIYKEWGVAGIKLDFVNSDKQPAMKWYEEVTAHAAKYNLMVSFHGSITPRGLRRTYPSIMTYEGVRGAEYYKFGYKPNMPTPIHNVTLPFTRNISGPMDYTPVSFSAKDRKTTYAHEMALPFVFESGWVCMADKPEEFRKSPAKELFKNLPAAWDEIHFIDGYPGEFCCLARRKGNNWYIAAINAGGDRSVTIDFEFIGSGDYFGKIYKDNKQDSVEIEEVNIPHDSPMVFDLPENGGFVIQLKEK
ncbi:MAG: glycoside hydrolase family 97 catalytic domain-containing protein [Bacteroidota bacterium]